MAVYFPDEGFEPEIPQDDEALWRYIDFTQFISILETRQLWFSAASGFTDKWEGGLTERQVERISEKIPSFVENGTDSVRQLYDALRATTYISCWHYRDEETAAMWEIYNNSGKEVAIKTTVGRLRRALRWSDDMVMGCVKYKDYNAGGDLFPITRNSPFFHKRLSFKHEHEFRVVKSEFNLPERVGMEDGLREIVAEKGGAGRAVDVDRGMLIDEVVVSPVAGGWMRRLVESVLDTHEMDDVIVSDSKLGGDPYSSDEV
jgi:hypothetical protein